MAETEYTKTLRDLREASGRSVFNVCTATLIRSQLLGEWEAGRVKVPPLILEALAALYQLELDVVTAAAEASREQGEDCSGVKT